MAPRNDNSLFIFSGLACVVVFSYPVSWPFTFSTREFMIIFVLDSSLSHSL